MLLEKNAKWSKFFQIDVSRFLASSNFADFFFSIKSKDYDVRIIFDEKFH